MKKKGEVERKNREKTIGGRNQKKKKFLKGRSARLGSVKKKEKRKKEREKINLIKEERETN